MSCQLAREGTYAMAGCEKCWADSGGDYGQYLKLIEDRWIQGEICTLEEQAGPSASICSKCGRKTVHQHAKFCIACGWKPTNRQVGETDQLSK